MLSVNSHQESGTGNSKHNLNHERYIKDLKLYKCTHHLLVVCEPSPQFHCGSPFVCIFIHKCGDNGNHSRLGLLRSLRTTTIYQGLLFRPLEMHFVYSKCLHFFFVFFSLVRTIASLASAQFRASQSMNAQTKG